MPLELWENMQKGERIAFDWLECACCSVPWEALKQLNGVWPRLLPAQGPLVCTPNTRLVARPLCSFSCPHSPMECFISLLPPPQAHVMCRRLALNNLDVKCHGRCG